jgi:hypothetical protein
VIGGGLGELVREVDQVAQVAHGPVALLRERVGEPLDELALLDEDGDDVVSVVERHDGGDDLVNIVMHSVVPLVVEEDVL